MDSWTTCVILTNPFIFKWIVFNHIEKWNLMVILKLVLLCERKSSALEKNGIWTNFIFQKLSAQDLRGWTLCVISQKWCYFWKCCLLQWGKDVFQNLTFAKNLQWIFLDWTPLPPFSCIFSKNHGKKPISTTKNLD